MFCIYSSCTTIFFLFSDRDKKRQPVCGRGFGDAGEPVDPVSLTFYRKGCLSWHVLYKRTDTYQLVHDTIFDVGHFCDYDMYEETCKS